MCPRLRARVPWICGVILSVSLQLKMIPAQQSDQVLRVALVSPIPQVTQRFCTLFTVNQSMLLNVSRKR